MGKSAITKHSQTQSFTLYKNPLERMNSSLYSNIFLHNVNMMYRAALMILISWILKHGAYQLYLTIFSIPPCLLLYLWVPCYEGTNFLCILAAVWEVPRWFWCKICLDSFIILNLGPDLGEGKQKKKKVLSGNSLSLGCVINTKTIFYNNLVTKNFNFSRNEGSYCFMLYHDPRAWCKSAQSPKN